MRVVLRWVVVLCMCTAQARADAGPPVQPTQPADDAAQTRAAAEPDAPAEVADVAEGAAPDQDGAGDAPAGSNSSADAAAPILDDVSFEGLVYFKDATARGFLLHEAGIPLDRALFHADAQRLMGSYHERGYLRATVTDIVVPAAVPGHVHGRIVIDAGARAELRRVSVIGNTAVSDVDLREGFFSRPPEPLGVLTRAGLFHRPYLDDDGKRLVANYYKRGYLEARVVSTRVTADADKMGLSAVLTVSEGPLYELAGLRITGDIPAGTTADEMRTAVNIADGAVCDLVSIQQQADGLLEPWRAAGHPFARFEQVVGVAPPPSGNPAHRAVALELRLSKGPTPVVRSVRVVGNKGTWERVFTRDIAVKEGKPYDHAAAKATERALKETGIFSAVSVHAIPVPGDDTQADVEVTVAEQQTWLASVAPAFDTTKNGEGLILIGIAADRSTFGSGIYTSLFARGSARRQAFDLTVSEPRLLDSHNTLSVELHRREIGFLTYRTRSELGGGVNVGVPFDLPGAAGQLSVGGGVAVEYGGVELYREANNDPFTGPQLVLSGAGDGGLLPADVFRNPVRLSVQWSRRDSLLLPRNGAALAVSASAAGPYTLSGVSFVDVGAGLKLYWTPLFGITFKSNTDVGVVMDPLGGRVPVTDRYFLGGAGSVRGFAPLSLSPTELAPVRGGQPEVPILAGGTTRAVQNVEVEFPLIPDTPFRGFVFLDAGNAFGEGELARVMQGLSINRGADLPLGLFVSTGFGLLLETPVLPFRFEWSVPLTARPGFDQPLNFFLGVGSAI